jgi:hypothetical protein
MALQCGISETDNPMPGSVDAFGNGLLMGNSSSTQSAVAVPNPGNPNIYYIFTVDCIIEDGFSGSSLLYCWILTLEDGLGDVIYTCQIINYIDPST